MEWVRIMVCLNGCNAGFSTTEHAMQFWKVDAQGKEFFTKVDHETKQLAKPRFLRVNDEQGYTRLLTMGRTGEFDVVGGATMGSKRIDAVLTQRASEDRFTKRKIQELLDH